MLHFALQPGGVGPFTEFDPTVDSYLIDDVVLHRGYNTPAMLTFTCTRPEQEMTFHFGDGIIFWDDAIGYTLAAPQFRGFVESVSPQGDQPHGVAIIAYDCTRASAIYVYAMNVPYQRTSPGLKPFPASNAYPRVVFNVHNYSDEDYAYSINTDDALADIIRTLFNYQLLPLQWYGAAPASPTNPWVDADLAPLTFHPQYKIVCESQTFRQALDTILKMDPRFKFVWNPQTQQWRFINIHQAPLIDLYTNNNGTDGKPVMLRATLLRSIQNRATAVKIVGPERRTMGQVMWSNGTLVAIDTYSGLSACGSGTGAGIGGHRAFQIVDPSKRRIARLLPAPIWAQLSDFGWIQVSIPILQATYAGDLGPTTYWNCQLDVKNGIVTSPTIVAKYDGTLSTCQYTFPTDVIFTYAYLDIPFVARYPSSGYAGNCPLQIEREIYDESLAIGREYGNPVTSTQRIAQFTALAQTIWEDQSDIAYTGVITLEGIQPWFMFLNCRVNVHCIDQNGVEITSDFATAAIPVTEVNYDYGAQTTQLTLLGDLLELFGEDDSLLKARQGIVNMAQKITQVYEMRITPNGSIIMDFTNKVTYFNPDLVNIATNLPEPQGIDTSTILGRPGGPS
jgi:hypothetical protein